MRDDVRLAGPGLPAGGVLPRGRRPDPRGATPPDHPDDDLLDPRAMRTIVFTALLVRLPDDAKLAASSSDGPHEHASAGEGTWWTLDQLAAAATCPAGTARYRACAAAIAKVDSYMQPMGDTPHFLRWGVRPEANANSSAAEHATAAVGLEARLEAAAAAATEFQKILESVRTTGTGESDGHAEFAHALAPLVDTTPGAALPAELLPLAPPAPPADAALRPFRHTAVIYFPTDPLPAPESQTPPEDGFWPHDVRDIVEGWALNEIRAWLAACLEWHRESGEVPCVLAPHALVLARARAQCGAAGRHGPAGWGAPGSSARSQPHGSRRGLAPPRWWCAAGLAAPPLRNPKRCARSSHRWCQT